MTTRGAAFAILLAESHATVVGEPLVPEGMSGDATVWNLLGSESELLGQAALIRNWADD